MLDKHYVGRDLTGFENNGKTLPVSRVTLMVDDENGFTAGDDTGSEIKASCPHATQEMADAILKKMKGYQYQMYTADAANIDPAAELGDGVTADGVYGVISQLSDDGGGYPNLTGPGEAELEDEYPIGEGPFTKEFNRKLGSTRSFIIKTATQIREEIKNEVDGLSSSFMVELGNVETELRDDINELSADVTLKYDELTASLSSGLEGLSADFSLRFDGLETSFRDDQEKQSAAFDVKLDGLSATFEDELNGVTSEFTTGLSGLSSRIEGVEKKANEDLAAYEEAVNKSLGELQKQIDGAIETWFFDYEPTNDNYPASEWTDEVTKQKHLKDLFYVVENEEKGGHAYRWVLVGNTYKWQLVEDVDVTKALAAAARAQDTADHKRRNFTEQPKPPYDVGDFWSQGPSGDLMRCKTARSSGDYVESDWEKASDYTDDSYAKEKYAELNVTLEGITTEVGGIGGRLTSVEQTASTLTTKVEGLDGRATSLEQTDESFKTQISGIEGRVSTVEQTATGLSTTVDGLGGQFTNLQQTVDGFTFTDDEGKVWINNGSLNLTGSITFGDLDSSTQSTINSKSKTFRNQPTGPYYVGDVWYKEDGTVWRCKTDETRDGRFYDTDWEQVTSSGVTEYEVHTFISDDLIAAPKIKGADIYGSAYHDDQETVDLTLFPVDLGEIQSAGLKLETSEKDEIFSVTPTFAYDYNTSGFRYSGANLVLGTVHAISGKIDTEGKKIIDIGFATSVDDLDIYVKNINFARTGTTVDLSRATLNGNVEEFYSGTLSSGSTSWAKALAAHNLYLVVGKPSSGSSYVSTLIPKQSLSNRFQLSDDSYYLTFTLTETNITINSNPSGGSITGVYGIK